MEVYICGTPSSPQSLIPQSLGPRAPTQAVKGPPYPPLQRLPLQVLWPQLGSRGTAQPQIGQSLHKTTKASLAPISQLEKPRPKEAIKI